MFTKNLSICMTLFSLLTVPSAGQSNALNRDLSLQPTPVAVEPGSQLIFLLDTGVDATSFDPTTILRDNGILAPRFTNFIAITNRNPEDAVTVQLHYYDENCSSIIDFLAVLTCNDTMLINPFDYTIPGSTINVSQRFFGQESSFPSPLPASAFGTGRFLLTVTAVGAVGNDSGDERDTRTDGLIDFNDAEDLDSIADWLFPRRLVSPSTISECSEVDLRTIGAVDIPNSNDHNLNILNASAISFNYLTGFHTVAVAREGGLASYGVTAWSRPAVNLSLDLDAEDSSEVPDEADVNPQDIVGPAPTEEQPNPSKEPDGVFDFFDRYNLLDSDLDGDGPRAPKRTVLAGSEEIWLTIMRDADTVLPANYFYLRHDAQGGNTLETNCQGQTIDSNRCDAENPFSSSPVNGGGFGWTLFPSSAVDAIDQFVFGASIKDDYNGSVNPFAPPGENDDNAYRISRAATYYEVAIYNNDEVLLDTIHAIGLNGLSYSEVELQVIPAPTLISGGPNVDFVFTRDLGTFSVQDILDLAPQLAEGFSKPEDTNDELGPGWLRFTRIATRDYWYESTSGSLLAFVQPYDGERGTYVSIAKNTVFQRAFGVSWYLD